MRYEMGLLCLQLDKPEVALHGGGDPTAIYHKLIHWDVNDRAERFNTLEVSQDVAQASRWGTVFTDKLLQWLNTLVWARADMSNPPLGISWFELICNFLITAQYPIPVNIAGKNSNYVTPDQTAHDLTQYDLGHTIMSFQRAISHLEFLSQTQLVPNNNGVKTGSLYYLGSGTMRMGFRSRPKMLRQQETMRYAWQYLSDHSKDGKVSFTCVTKCTSSAHSVSHAF